MNSVRTPAIQYCYIRVVFSRFVSGFLGQEDSIDRCEVFSDKGCDFLHNDMYIAEESTSELL
jgi:hypothetical protein